jgi:hypothetical protein
MNKKGKLGIAIISAIFVFIIGMAVINLLMPEIATFRIDMNCADASSISDGTKLLCLVGGIAIPYWILLIVSITIGGIISEVII